MMASSGDSPSSLAEKMGTSDRTLRGLIAGSVRIDRTIADRLSTSLGGTPKFWLARQATYEGALDRVTRKVSPENARAWLRNFPRRELAEQGWLPSSASRDEATRNLLAYFGVASPDEWEVRYKKFLAQVAFRTSSVFESKIGALTAWLRQGELQAETADTAPWNPTLLRHSIGQLRTLTKQKAPGDFVPRIRQICAQAGVAVVFVRAPSGCRASGATRFLTPKKAMIVLSFRYLSNDHFWFTFFHELGHILLHGNSATFADGESARTRQELDANAFAQRVLIPSSRYDDLVELNPLSENIIRFAVSIGVAPGIVVGQMQHLGLIRQDKMNFLKRRYTWDDITGAVG
jgi:plasmid maintenance system antidote protein VapI